MENSGTPFFMPICLECPYKILSFVKATVFQNQLHKHNTMKKALLPILLFLFPICLFSQENIDVDYSNIKEYIQKQPGGYAQLTERFEINDSLLTLNDYALIYYGYSFTSKYKGSMDIWQDVDSLMEEKRMEEAYEQVKEYRKANPVSLKLLIYAVNLASELQKEEEVQSYVNKYVKLSSAILSSGDGTSEETAFKVICVNDEYQILYNVFDVQNLKQQSLVNNCDLMEFESSPYYQGTQIYFDISRSLDFMEELFNRKK